MKQVLVGLALAAGVGAAAGCTKENFYPCTDSSSCSYLADGTCKTNPATGTGWCAAPDSGCTSGYRWDDVGVGDDVANACVPEGGSPDAAPGCTLRVAWRSERNGNGSQNLWVADADGSGQTGITSLINGHVQNPSWSPVGDLIAYASGLYSSSPTTIWVTSPDGAIQHGASSAGYVDDWPAWSRDGSRLAFTRERTAFRYDVWVVNNDGSVEVKLTPPGGPSDEFPVWSPGADRIAVAGASGASGSTRNIYVFDDDGGNRVNLTNDTGSVNSVWPRWAPDGNRIAFASDRSGNDEIWTVDTTGDHLVNLTQTPADRETRPRWSPDGSRIFYQRGATGSAELWMMNADGTGQLALGPAPPDYVPDFELSPDGAFVVLSSSVDGNAEIYRISADGASRVRLTSDPDYEDHPVWSPCLP